METSIDLYAEEYAEDYDEIDDNDENAELENENLIQHEQLENAEDNNDAQDDKEQDDEEAEKKKVKPKRVIKNPRPKLDVERLKGHKGLMCLEGYFKNKKYKGKGYEEEDLKSIMKTYEYWCHRLFPKFPFDDCLAKIEKLGTKKNVQTFINRIRMDLAFDEDQPVRSNHEEEQDNTEPNSDQFDSLLPQLNNDHEDIPTLSEEQLERIRLNREKANRLRLERLQKAKEKAEALTNVAKVSQQSCELNNADVTNLESISSNVNIHEITNGTADIPEENILPQGQSTEDNESEKVDAITYSNIETIQHGDDSMSVDELMECV